MQPEFIADVPAQAESVRTRVRISLHVEESGTRQCTPCSNKLQICTFFVQLKKRKLRFQNRT
jgi:hypothetical protein